MKNKILCVILPGLLCACASTPPPPVSGVIPVQIPDLPAELSTKAERLPPLADPTLGGMVTSGIQADTAYNDVAYKYNNIIDFYNCIKVAINTKKDPAEICLK